MQTGIRERLEGFLLKQKYGSIVSDSEQDVWKELFHNGVPSSPKSLFVLAARSTTFAPCFSAQDTALKNSSFAFSLPY